MSNKIKRPMNAYMLFSKEKRAEIVQQKPELKSKVAQFAKLIGNHWKEMTSEEKSKYQNLALEDKKDMKAKYKNKYLKFILKSPKLGLFIFLILNHIKFYFVCILPN